MNSGRRDTILDRQRHGGRGRQTKNKNGEPKNEGARIVQHGLGAFVPTKSLAQLPQAAFLLPLILMLATRK